MMFQVRIWHPMTTAQIVELQEAVREFRGEFVLQVWYMGKMIGAGPKIWPSADCIKAMCAVIPKGFVAQVCYPDGTFDVDRPEASIQ